MYLVTLATYMYMYAVGYEGVGGRVERTARRGGSGDEGVVEEVGPVQPRLGQLGEEAAEEGGDFMSDEDMRVGAAATRARRPARAQGAAHALAAGALARAAHPGAHAVVLPSQGVGLF